MGLMDLSDRLNWEQACRVLGISKSTLFRLTRKGELTAYGVYGSRFWLRSECFARLAEKKRRGSA